MFYHKWDNPRVTHKYEYCHKRLKRTLPLIIYATKISYSAMGNMSGCHNIIYDQFEFQTQVTKPVSFSIIIKCQVSKEENKLLDKILDPKF